MYSVQLSASAQRFYARSDPRLAKKLARCFAQLERDPRRHSNIKPLKGPYFGFFRFRVGDYRVVYRIDDAGKVVIVRIIAHRREVYD